MQRGQINVGEDNTKFSLLELTFIIYKLPRLYKYYSATILTIGGGMIKVYIVFAVLIAGSIILEKRSCSLFTAAYLRLPTMMLLIDKSFIPLYVHIIINIRQHEVSRMHYWTNDNILFVIHDINKIIALGDRAIIVVPKSANIKREFTPYMQRLCRLNYPLIHLIAKGISKDLKMYERYFLYILVFFINNHNICKY